MVGLGRERCVQGDDVALSSERAGVGVFDAVLPRPLDRWKRIERQHPHAEPPQDLRGDAADSSGAENAGGLAVKIESDEAIEREIEVVHAIARPGNFAIESEQQRDRMFGDGVRRVSRDTRDREPQLFGGGDVNAVVSGAAQGDVLYA